MKQLKGRKALITGAAGGIGRAIAAQLAHKGVDLWLVDTRKSLLLDLSHTLEHTGINIIVDKCDLVDPNAVEQTINNIQSKWGALHLLINNAGVCYYGKTRDMTIDQWNLIMNVNLQAPFRLIHGLLPLLEKQDCAHVANICSMYGLVTYRKQAAYQASKFALVGLTQSLRMEYAGKGLGFSAICPGYVRNTQFFDTMQTPPKGKTRHPPSLITCTPDKVARRTIGAILHNRAIVVITPLARWQWLTHRIMPGIIDRLQQIGFGYNAYIKRVFKRDSG